MIGPEQLAAGLRAETAGDYVAAAAAFRAILDAPDMSVAAQAQFSLGRVCWRQGRYEAALGAFESARALAERTGDDELRAQVSNGVGAVYYARHEYAAAREAYADAAARTNDETMSAKVLLNLGVIENVEGNLTGALSHYERAFRIFERSGDRASATLALHNRGMVQADLHLWDDADASFLGALTLATDSGNPEMVAKTLVNRSEVLVERGAFTDAVAHCDRALDIYANMGEEVGRGEALRWRAHALGRAGDHQQAERDATEALHIANRCGARLLEAESARAVGVLRGLLGDRAGGIKQLRNALALFTELGEKREAKEVGALLQRPTPARSLQRIVPDPESTGSEPD
ncbi:MAG: tetratricopeptide repeat protein [Gemmatimonadota bacterium]|nr:tetratricopeptide repeat protein [Gemmatimonadota bacterium]